MSRSACTMKLTSGICGKETVSDSTRCILHHPKLWKTNPELVREELDRRMENGDSNFVNCHIPEIIFTKKIMPKRLDFSGARFHGRVQFMRVKFGTIDFSNAKFSGDVYFTGSKFKGDIEFSQATFDGHTSFENVTFGSYTGFNGATFRGTAIFTQAEFKGRKTHFDNSSFLGCAQFDKVHFEGEVEFRVREFSSNVVFNSSRFERSVDFGRTIFSGLALFAKVEFGGDTYFENARFLHEANFTGSDFVREVSFRDAVFSVHADFTTARFHGPTDFMGVDLSITKAYFDNAIFSEYCATDESKWSKSHFRLCCEEVSLSHAISSYHALRKISLQTGHYTMAGELFYNEMLCRKRLCSITQIILVVFRRIPPRIEKILRFAPNAISRFKSRATRVQGKNLSKHYGEESIWKGIVNWVWMWIFYATCGFGEKPLRVLISSLSIIGAFAVVYASIIDLPTTLLERFYLGLSISFSVFALGRAQVTLPPMAQWIMLLQTVLGATMISLFLVVFVRKMTRS